MGAFNPLNAVFGLAGLLAKPFKDKPKAPKVPMQQPMAQTRTTAVLDAVAGRRGSRVNQRSGRGGAEAPPGQKTQLGA
jgi:hypothetical protein